MYDLVIRGGEIFDGRGGKSVFGDVAVVGERINYIGPKAGPGRDEIDATGKIVTPGFVDVHTHFDAQATWDSILAPSSWHGVTSLVIGNCGVGFAPVKPEQRPWLIEVMENVEEIPRNVLNAGLFWTWETFPEYLDSLDALPHAVDIGAQVTHIPLRGYVMGPRAAADEPATAQDIATMAELLKEGLQAGAVGFSCSRTNFHRTSAGKRVPGSMGDREELLQLSDAVKRAGGSVIQCLTDMKPASEEFDWLEQMSIRSGSPVGFSLFQSPVSDRNWRWQLERLERAAPSARLVGHVAARGVGSIMQWQATSHPFIARPTFCAIAHLPWEELYAKLGDAQIRQQILSEENQRFDKHAPEILDRMLNGFQRQFELDDELNFEPDPEYTSIAARAKRMGLDPAAYAYDVLMRYEGHGLIYLPVANYDDGGLDHARELLMHPSTVVSLSDAGAHCTRVVDAVAPTFMLTHWARDRSRGAKLPLEIAIKSYSLDTAASYGFNDRGVLAVNYLADINVIDFERLKLLRPYLSFDLPAGGRRLLQAAEGYVATVKRGKLTFRHGMHTGALPGRVIRGRQPAPDSTN